MDKIYSLKISGEKFTHEQEIDSIQKAKIIAFLTLPESNLLHDEKIPHVPSLHDTNPVPSLQTVNISPREYLNEKKPVTMPQKIAVAVSFLKDIMHIDFVTKEQVQKVFADAREPYVSKNFGRDFDRAIRNGWIFLSPTEGKYFVTPTGETVISTKFDSLVRTTTNKKGSVKKQSKVVVREAVEKLELQPEIEGYEYYWKLNVGERVLWILAQAKEKDITDLNYKEISRLADKVGDHIEPKQISSLIAAHVKFKRVFSLSPQDIKVLRIAPQGIDHVKVKKSLEESA